ncbi:glycerol-3-phosphate 1-O-acyltransferase PlsY [Marininema halotolerans]|uniref:Glycerol-3-phosphate acyltransferase n=1 Tax=Marininema halotolerans TaxID=1155944 RepID=A0A1I6TYC3_9BACL|nr:glycerol-3-phosphate 1-O-acyltransferase PlsY [Marininema halotolerans]SFS94175.1 glycerol-3-phosphate acyltransferase PlsY [Marininema halotolerans]
MTGMSLLAILIAYLLGSISFSYVITRWTKGYDIRERGSGNAGSTNMLRVVGKGPAVLVFILDVIKGMAAVGVGYAFGVNETMLLGCGVAAIIGHNWPIFLGFRGGKGIATTIGVTALMTLSAALSSGVVAILAVILTRYVSLGSLIFIAGLPIMISILDYPTSYIYLSLIIALLGFIRHWTNIKRLAKGTESKIGSAKPQN